jgi:predicted secreted protein
MSRFLIFSIALLLFILPTSAYAHNNSEYEFYGFSEDQKYCIFEVYGEYETESTSYSETHIIEVDTNKDIVKPIHVEKKDNKNEPTTIFEIRKENMGNVIPYIKKYDFDSFYKGTLLFTNPRYGDYIHTQTKPDYENPTFVMGNETYTIKLSQRKTDPKNTDYYAQKEFDLNVITKNKTITLAKHKTITVTQHKTIPAAFNYRIVSAYYCYGKIAVIIEYDTVDFEGESRRQTIVTGVIKTENLDMQYD